MAQLSHIGFDHTTASLLLFRRHHNCHIDAPATSQLSPSLTQCQAEIAKCSWKLHCIGEGRKLAKSDAEQLRIAPALLDQNRIMMDIKQNLMISELVCVRDRT